MKISFILFSIVAILVIGLSYDFLAYGDHPDPTLLTFNQESYEYGDTLIITAKLPQPFDSVDGRDTQLTLDFVGGTNYLTEGQGTIVNSTGYAVFEYPLTDKNLRAGESTIKVYFIQYSLNDKGEVKYGQHRTENRYPFLINSDQTSIIIDSMKTLKSLNSTAINDDRIKLGFLDKTVTNIHESLVILSQKVNKTIEDEIKVLRKSITAITKEIGFIVGDIEFLEDSFKSQQKEIDALTKQVDKNTKQIAKNTSHGNNGTKHHGAP